MCTLSNAEYGINVPIVGLTIKPVITIVEYKSARGG